MLGCGKRGSFMTDNLHQRRVEAAAKYIQNRYIDLEYQFAEDIAKGALAAADAVKPEQALNCPRCGRTGLVKDGIHTCTPKEE